MPEFDCSSCGQHIDADESLAGVTTACPTCQGEVTVPGFPVARPIAQPVQSIPPPSSSITHNVPSRRAVPRAVHYEGIGRLPFFGLLLGSWVLQAVLQAVLGDSGAGSAIATLIGIVILFALVIYRLKNIGMSPAWCVLLIVPIANLLIFVRCLIFPEGYSETGKLDTFGKVATGVVVILVVFLVVCKRLILARLKKRASEFKCVRLRDAKSFSREPARGVAA